MERSKRWETIEQTSLWRRIAVGMWGAPSEPTIYGTVTAEVADLLAYLDAIEAASGHRVTPTAFFVKVLATFFERHPDLNVIVVGNEVKRRTSIDIFCQVAIPSDGDGDGDGDQADLSGVKLSNCDQMDLVEVSERLRGRATDVRSGDDEELEKQRSIVDYVPSRLMPAMVRAIEFLTYAVPWDLDALGIRSDPFGSAMLSSVGQFEVEQAFAPLVPASRSPVVILPGVIHEKPVARDGEVHARQVVTLSITADHRCYDGYQGGQFVRTLKTLIEHPREHFPAPQTWGGA